MSRSEDILQLHVYNFCAYNCSVKSNFLQINSRILGTLYKVGWNVSQMSGLASLMLNDGKDRFKLWLAMLPRAGSLEVYDLWGPSLPKPFYGLCAFQNRSFHYLLVLVFIYLPPFLIKSVPLVVSTMKNKKRKEMLGNSKNILKKKIMCSDQWKTSTQYFQRVWKSNVF